MLPAWHELPGAPRPGTVLARRDEMVDGGALLREVGDSDPPFRIILLRSGEEVFAYVNRCAHFGVPLATRVEHLGLRPHQTLRCSVHYARYRWQDGWCEFGDCRGESLLAIPVRVSAGEVVVSAAGPARGG
jgi:nitrite reductase/ring-hydroxylating ferredoxin subunit